MRVARNARCGFRSSPAREILIGIIAISEIELSCGKHGTKQISNRDKTRLLPAPRRNAFFGISTPVFAPTSDPLRSYPFAQSRKAVRSRPTRMLTLEIALRRLG
jgi:hypothetical protein